MTRAPATAVAVVTMACASSGAARGPACVVPGSPEIDAALVDRLEGRYRLEQVATFGPEAGTTASGSLDLQPNAPDMTAMRNADGSTVAGVSTPYHGTLEMSGDVGALIPGDPASTDPQRPGALVIFRNGADMIIRIGSQANDRTGPTLIESTYLVFRIRSLSRERFTGTWTSGMREEVASGYFCAVKN